MRGHKTLDRSKIEKSLSKWIKSLSKLEEMKINKNTTIDEVVEEIYKNTSLRPKQIYEIETKARYAPVEDTTEPLSDFLDGVDQDVLQ